MIVVGLQGYASVVAARILKDQGEVVRGAHFTFRSALGSLDETQRLADWCTENEIDFISVDVSDEFEAFVVDGFVHSVLRGQTFEPRLRWMQDIVLSKISAIAGETGSRWATGHFAMSTRQIGNHGSILSQPAETAADQSLDFFTLGYGSLTTLDLPLGTLTRSMVQKLAIDSGWNPSQDRRSFFQGWSSEGLPGADADWLAQRIPMDLRPRGILKNLEGQVVDEHTGIHRHRVGSSMGREVSPGEASVVERVIEVDPRNSVVVIGAESALASLGYVLGHVRWVAGGDSAKDALPVRGKRVVVASESVASRAAGFITPYAADRVTLELDAPWHALPGSSVAFYVGKELMGGARVERRLPR